VNLRRGTLFLMTAWAVMLVTGYVLTLVLARRFPMDDYGDYGLVMSVLLWLEIVVINGLPVAVQKFTASQPDRAGAILWTALRLQAVAAAALVIAGYLAAPALAGYFRDGRLAAYFRIAFLNIVFYGFFHLMAAYQNGLGRFRRQAFLLLTLAFARMGFVVAFVLCMRSIAWALWGNIAGAVLGLIAGVVILDRGWKGGAIAAGPLLRFAAPSVLYSLGVTLLLSIDLWSVNRMLGKSAGAVYVASSMVARIPYFLVFGLSSAVLPAIASALAVHDRNKVQAVLRQAFRFLLMLTAPLAVLATVYRKDIMVLLFADRFGSGGAVLGILIWGMVMLSFYILLTTIINAEGRPAVSFFITLAVVAVDVSLIAVFVPRLGARGAALATTCSLGLGVLISAWRVRGDLDVHWSWKPFGRIALASLAAGAIALAIPVRRGWILPVGAAVLGMYALVLFAAGEISKQDVVWLLKTDNPRLSE